MEVDKNGNDCRNRRKTRVLMRLEMVRILTWLEMVTLLLREGIEEDQSMNETRD